MAIYIDIAHCSGCGDCVAACTPQALSLLEGVPHVDTALCNNCGACVEACPEQAILLVEEVDTERTGASPAGRTVVDLPAPKELATRDRVPDRRLASSHREIYSLLAKGALATGNWALEKVAPAVIDALTDRIAGRDSGRRPTSKGARRGPGRNGIGTAGKGRRRRRKPSGRRGC